ncbi:MAG: DUF2029 domain-containing protein [Acetobacteraceae bacterium]|nr:DUF2029 domain-containing protein [Acetobacteraceae bacterium]
MISLVVLGAGLIALVIAGLALHIPGAGTVGSDARLDGFVAILAVAALLYLLGVRLVLRRTFTRGALVVVIGIAIAMRIPPLMDMAFLSSDIYRYVWDGRVQVAGFNPYEYIPADAALAPFQDEAIYIHINRRDYAPTIYPPAAQIVFATVAYIDDSVFAFKAAAVVFEALAIGCVLVLLRLARLPLERVLIYAWNPLVVWSFAGNGHVDAIAIGLLSVALVLRTRGRDLISGVVFGAAVLVKLLPLAVAPALWRRAAWWRAPLGCAAAIAALYLYYADAGWRVMGFLPGYAAEEGLATGGGIWLLAGLNKLVALPPQGVSAYLAASVTILALLAAWIALRPRPADEARNVVRLCGNFALLAACATVALSPHYTWYFAWLALPSCVCTWRSVVYLSVAPVLLYIDPLDDRFFWPSLVYLPAAVLAVRDVWQHLRQPVPSITGATERSI